MNGEKMRDSKTPYEKLEEATRTLEKERQFFEILMKTDPAATRRKPDHSLGQRVSDG